jgi:putative transposase
MTKRSPFRHFRTTPGIIRPAAMLCVRSALSLETVEDLPHERGIGVSDERVRSLWHCPEPVFPSEIRKRRIEGLRSRPWRWHLDEMFGTKSRDKMAALKSLTIAMRKHGRPEVIVTGRHRSCGAALKGIGADDARQ